MLFATAFLPMFGIGGLTGIPLAFNSADLYLHDTYYIIAHFHYIVAPGTIFGLFAGVYYWFPKATGRKMNDFWGKVHFWADAHLHECDFSSNVPAGNGRDASAVVRWRPRVDRVERSHHLGIDRVSMEPSHFMGRWIMGLAQSVHH